jgi:hypothetical protein
VGIGVGGVAVEIGVVCAQAVAATADRRLIILTVRDRSSLASLVVFIDWSSFLVGGAG